MSGRVRILHVEDDPRDAELVREVLLADRLDCDVVRVDSREAYLAALEQGNFDLIVCDYTLPSFQGGEALELAGSRWSHIPFLFLSGTIGEERAVEALKNGATEYVLKSNLARLPSAVRRAMREAREHEERRKAEAALRASEQRTRALMENAKDAIVVGNIQGIIVEVNRAAESLYARPRAHFVGRHFQELLVADERESARRHFESILAGQAPEVHETIALAADGRTVPIEVSGSLVEIGGECLVLAIVRDVSERKLLEEQFRQAQKMEAVGRLAGGVAHDFNNLLTVILGYSDARADQLHGGPACARSVEQIRKAGERAAALTRQLLAFSRKQVLQPQLIDVDDDRDRHRADAAPPDRRGHRPVTVCDPRTRAGQGGPGPDRAGAHEPGGERARRHARRRRAHASRRATWSSTRPTPASTCRRSPGPYVMIAVSDTGSGMDEETKAHIFEPFFTTKEKGKGTGLGLATVYGIVKQSGGFLWVYSEPGSGTVFKICLPRVEEEPDSRRQHPAPAPRERARHRDGPASRRGGGTPPPRSARCWRTMATRSSKPPSGSRFSIGPPRHTPDRSGVDRRRPARRRRPGNRLAPLGAASRHPDPLHGRFGERRPGRRGGSPEETVRSRPTSSAA